MKISKTGIIDFILITIGTIICGVATYFFMVPSNLAIASVSGVAILIGKCAFIKSYANTHLELSAPRHIMVLRWT